MPSRHRFARTICLCLAVGLLVAGPAQASGAQSVAIRTASYDPSVTELGGLGIKVRWTNVTTPSRVHDVVSGLPEYFHMSLSGSGSTYAFRFTAAGEFTYYCSIHDTMIGAVSVPLTGTLVNDVGGTRFHIQVASVASAHASRYVSILLVQDPSDTAPHRWRSTRGISADYTPSTPGDYTFFARVKDTQTKRHSANSPPLVLNFAG